MKKISIFLLGSILLYSCSKEDTPPVNENQAPSQPQLRAPQNDLFCTTSQQVFQWAEVSDPEENQVFYTLEISTDEDFQALFFTGKVSSLSKSVPLEKGENYYWRVLAEDDKGNKGPYSHSRRLYTEGDATSNFLPTAPVAVSPEETGKVTGDSVTLEWTAEDADGDALLYDLYFGKSKEPELLTENLDTTSHEVDIEPGSTYYWKVVAKDEHSGKTTGNIWTFDTE